MGPECRRKERGQGVSETKSQQLPRPSLAFVERAGPPELFRTPEQEIFPGIRSWMNQPYAMIPGTRILRLDVHVSRNTSGPVPAAIFAPGGAWMLVAKNHAPWRALLDAGIAVVAIEYRLSGEAQWPAQLHDAKAAVRWVRTHAADFGIDPDRIAGWGCSAGGYIMSMLAPTTADAAFEVEIVDDRRQSSKSK